MLASSGLVYVRSVNTLFKASELMPNGRFFQMARPSKCSQRQRISVRRFMWRLRAILGVLALSLPAAHAAPDLSTREGRFLNLTQVLAFSGRLDSPDEAGRLLRTHFQAKDKREYDLGQKSCSGAPNNIFAGAATKYASVVQFWFTEGIQDGSRSLKYESAQYTQCDGLRYGEGEIQFIGINQLFCVHVNDVESAGFANLKEESSFHSDSWVLYFDGWDNNTTGTRVIFTWPLVREGGFRDHEECLTSAVIRQAYSFNARIRRSEEARKRERNYGPLIGPGSGRVFPSLNSPQ